VKLYSVQLCVLGKIITAMVIQDGFCFCCCRRILDILGLKPTPISAALST
jgi:hypothetical protein